MWYLVRKTIYTEFDGYVHTEYKDLRAVEDIYLFDQFTEEGDIVVPGDTLYAYTYLSMFDSGNVGTQPDIIVNDRNMKLQRDNAYAEASVLRVRIAELEEQIRREENNIRFGMTDNSHKMDLERQLSIARAELNATLQRAYRYGAIHKETNDVIEGSGQFGIDLSNEHWGLDHALRELYEADAPIIRYAIAQDTAMVTKVWAPSFSRVFKKEHILQLEDLSYDKSNVQVIAWVPTQDMDKINNNTRAEIIVNDDVSFMASVQLLGARTEDLPEELRNNLSHTYTAVMVVLRPDRDQELPLWAVVDRVPVRVRVKNYDNGKREDGSDYWYINNYGMTEKSKEFFDRQRVKEKSRFRYDPLRETIGLDTVSNLVVDTVSKNSQIAPQKPAQNTENAKSDTAKNMEYFLHTIEEGETPYSVSRKYKVSLEKLSELNPDAMEKFPAGTKLKIPK